jgi:ubiquitin-like-conjugating enzyme ATG3
MEYSNEQECIIELDDAGGWVDTHHYATSIGLDDRVTEMSLEETLEEPSKNQENVDDDDDDEDAADMETFEFSGILDEQDKV